MVREWEIFFASNANHNLSLLLKAWGKFEITMSPVLAIVWLFLLGSTTGCMKRQAAPFGTTSQPFASAQEKTNTRNSVHLGEET
jgi:hypothetical protein